MRAKRHNGHSEWQLDGSEEIYRLIAEHSTDMISKHTPEGIYTYASPACRSLLGYEPEELIGRSAYDFFHPQDLDVKRESHSAILEMPGVSRVKYRNRRKDCSYIWFETISKTVRDEKTGDAKEIIAVSRDISEHKRTEEALRESREALRKSEEFHRFAAEAGRIGTWDLNLQTEECLISPKMTELMGFSPSQTIVPAPQWREAIVPDDRPLMASALTASIEGDAPLDLEFRVGLKDGTERWLYSRGGVARDASGKALRVHGASIDVTERKRAEENLRRSEERLRQAIGIETVGVLFFRADGSITDANDAFLRMSGYSREDMAEGLVRWDQMTPPEWMPHSLKAIEEFESTGRTVPYEKEYIRKDGSRWWGLFAARRLDEEEGVEFIIDITESQRAEEDLRRSNRRIVNILESITDAFFAVDGDWRFTYVNRQAEQVWQRSREGLLGKNLWEEFPEAVGSMFYEKYHEAVRSRAPIHFEEFYSPLDHWVEVHAYPTTGEGLAVYFQDITERKQGEEELRESEERFRATFEQAAVGVAHNALDGRWLRVNQKLCTILGYSREELLQKAFQDVTHPEDVEPNLAYLRQLLTREIGSFSMEKRYVRKDGSIIWGELTVSLVREPSGEPSYLISVVEDITERKRAEEELRFRKALLEAQTETSIDGILVASSDGQITSYNQRFVEMWDMPEEVLSTRSDEAAIKVAKDRVADPQRYMARVNYLYEHPGEESHEEIQLKDGRTFDRYSAAVTGADGTHYGRVWYFRDITRRKRVEESLLEIREAERRRIARDLHDAVLQDLSGTLQGLQAVQVEFDSTDHKVDLKRETDALKRAVVGLRSVVHDLRQEKEQPFVTAIEALVEYNRQLAPERQIRLSVQEGFPQELPDPVKMELLRMVQEALSNIRQHSDAHWLGVKLHKQQDQLCTEVIDDGRGFDPESVRRGLGLLGMRERVETFGGELEIRSRVGKGTMVSVTVPTQVLARDK